MHRVMSRNDHAIDVLSFQQLGIMVEPFAGSADEIFCLFNALAPDITYSGHGHVVFLRMGLNLAHVGIKTLRSDADESYHQSVVCAADARRRCLALSIDWRFDQGCARNSSSGSGGLLNELSAWNTGSLSLLSI